MDIGLSQSQVPVILNTGSEALAQVRADFLASTRIQSMRLKLKGSVITSFSTEATSRIS